MDMTVSAIVLNWNGGDMLDSCLGSLLSTDYAALRIILVDNGSTDGSADRAAVRYPAVEVVRNRRNIGYPAGNNVGIKYALRRHNPDFVALLNNDTRFDDPEWLAKMVSAAAQRDRTGITGCRLVFPDGRPQHAGSMATSSGFRGISEENFGGSPSDPYEVDAVIGAVFMIKREVIERIGLLDEGFYPYLGEDMDYCARARRAGYKIIVAPSAEVVHLVSKSIEKNNSVSTLVIHKKNEIRYRLLNSSASELARFAVLDAAHAASAVFERKDRTRRALPFNFRVRKNGSAPARIYAILAGYILNAAGIFGIIALSIRSVAE